MKSLVDAIMAWSNPTPLDDAVSPGSSRVPILRLVTAGLCVLTPVTPSCGTTLDGNATGRFVTLTDSPQKARVDERFSAILPNNQLVANGAVTPIRVLSGELFLVSVGVVAMSPTGHPTPQRTLDIQRIALAKARAHLAEYCRVDVDSMTELRTVSTIHAIAGEEVLETAELLETSIFIRAHELIRDSEIVGEWYSQDGSTFHLAIAVPLSGNRP